MRRLLDTRIYLWFLADAPALGDSARRRIESAREVFVSAASIWEAAIKIGLGKLEVRLEDLVDGIAASRFQELPVLARHAAFVGRLPPVDRDPFDRLLIAQAMDVPLTLLTADPLLTRYPALVELVR